MQNVRARLRQSVDSLILFVAGVTHFSVLWVKRGGMAALFLAGIMCVEVREYAFALFPWGLFSIALSVMLFWPERGSKSGLGKFLAYCCGVVTMALLLVWTVAAKGSDPWTNFSRLWPIKQPVITSETRKVFVDPQIMNSDAEQLPNIDITKRPLIVGQIGDVVSCRPGNAGRTIIYMMVSLTDRGLPSSIGGWKLRYKSLRLKQQFEFVQIANVEGCRWQGRTYVFHGEDSIYERSAKRLETGSLVRGWAKFEVPGFLYDEIGTRDAELAIHVWDFQNHEYVLSWVGSGITSTHPEYYPGIHPTEISH